MLDLGLGLTSLPILGSTAAIYASTWLDESGQVILTEDGEPFLME